MKKAFRKDIRIEIRKTMKRFISIAVMAFLGVALFVGIKGACYDMKKTGDRLFDAQRLYDIQVMSTLGLTKEDVAAVAGIEGVEEAEGSSSVTAEVAVKEARQKTKIHMLSEAGINAPYLVEGKLPQKAGEIAVIEEYAKDAGAELGETIRLFPEEGDDTLTCSEFTITAIVGSPLYTQKKVEGSSVAGGEVKYSFFVTKDSMDSPVYTEVYAVVKGARELDCYSNQYQDKIEAVTTAIECTIKKPRQQARDQELKEEADQEIEKAAKELSDQEADGRKEISDARQKLLDGKAELEQKAKEISNAKQEISDGKKQISDGKQQIVDGRNSIAGARAQIQEGKGQLEAKKQELANARQTADEQFKKAQEDLADAKEKLAGQYEAGSQEYQYALAQLEKQQTMLDQQKAQTYTELDAGDSQTAQSEMELAGQETMLDQQEAELAASEQILDEKEAELKEADRERKEGETKLAEARAELTEGEAELKDQEAEFEEKIQEAEKKLSDARKEAASIEKAKWYVLTRKANEGFASLKSDTESIEALGSVFPIIFFLVAVLISLTTMTRMVEEQRSYIGTLKALGYTDGTIGMKYILYALLASLLGCAAGNLIGFTVLPEFLWYVMGNLHNLPGFSLHIQWLNGIGITLVCTACLTGATAFSCYKTLKHNPAQLMRPKAPKKGSRVLLERMTFIWKRLKFLNKVTARNLFRYKKRMLMTITGIMGCSALLVTGFGLRDSMKGLLLSQYGEIHQYDMLLVTTEGEEQLQERKEIDSTLKIMAASINVSAHGESGDIQIFVVEEPQQLSKYVNMTSLKGKPLSFGEDSVILTRNAAETLGVETGEQITLKNTANKETETKLTGIAQNYLGNYIYLSKSSYEKLYDDYEANSYLVELSLKDPEEIKAFGKELQKEETVSSVTVVEDLQESFGEKLELVNGVVYLMILMAAALAFVVLFTLANVNIAERIRELATIKVLGFYDREVYRYIMKETDILTGIGAVLGLPAGYGVCWFILSIIKIPDISFNLSISPLSYLISLGLTVVFEAVVNRITNRTLKQIDMVEALKSVE